ncbi:TPA: hypothetical protein QCY03_003509 [Bacillus tropicus]|nr:hypothetical protein [Bacillus tropicus]
MKPQTRILRPTVTVDKQIDQTTISFAHWKVAFPTEVFLKDSSLVDLVNTRKININSIKTSSINILKLLEAQGCFLPAIPGKLTARTVLKLFQPIRSEFYAQYYSHPIWTRLRTGKASRGELTAWMIHNYHVSRSAGVIAARMAASTKDKELRAFFREDALEEYWHCDKFYFVEQAGFKLSASDVKNYVPLPASTAFEDHALRVAEEDPLGHLLIAYLQESSIIFREESEEFYDTIENNYKLSNAFVGWRKHMTLDMDHDHAGELEACFDDKKELTLSEVATSIRSVQLAQFYLLRALDQIAEYASIEDALSPRLPISLVNNIHGRNDISAKSMTLDSGIYLFQAVRDGAFRALALARTHDQIIVSGDLAARTASIIFKKTVVNPDEPWLVACRNFILEQATDPEVFVELATILIKTLEGRCPELRNLITNIHKKKIVEMSNPRTRLAAFKLNELLEQALMDKPLTALPLVDIDAAG